MLIEEFFFFFKYSSGRVREMRVIDLIANIWRSKILLQIAHMLYETDLNTMENALMNVSRVNRLYEDFLIEDDGVISAHI